MNWKPTHPAFQALLSEFLHEITPVYAVGGVVRDHLLGQSNKLTDLDLVVEQAAIPISRRVADRLGWAFYPLDETRDVARLIFAATHGEPLVCDIAGQRGISIEADLRSRDFTINAMAFEIERLGKVRLIDVCGGQDDLNQRTLRRVNSASLPDDPLRMLRAARMLIQFNLTIDPVTLQQIERFSSSIKLSSAERIRDELWKLLLLDRPDQAIEEIRKFHLLSYLLPEVASMIGVEQSFPHHLDVYQHTLLAMRKAAIIRDWLKDPSLSTANAAQHMWQNALKQWQVQFRRHFTPAITANHSRADWLVWHALFHDVGKAKTRTAETDDDGSVRYRFFEHEKVGATMTEERLSALRFSRHEIALCQAVVNAHMRPHMLHNDFSGKRVSRRSAYRFFRDVGGQQFEQPVGVDTLLLALADYQAIHQGPMPPAWESYLGHVGELLAFRFDNSQKTKREQQPLLNGAMLIHHLNLKPSRQIGELLEHLQEARVAGEISTTEEALTLAKEWLRTQKV